MLARRHLRVYASPDPVAKTLIEKSTIRRLGIIAIALVAVAGLAACGKRQPPQPPIEKIRQRVDVKAIQRGNQILLTWKMPAFTQNANSLSNVVRADIYRLASPASSKESVSEEDFSSAATLINSVAISKQDFGQEFTVADRLDLAGQSVTLRYSVRLVNASGQKASFSNFAVVNPASKIALAPSGIQIEASQDALTISWKAPDGNIDGSTPANVIGYNVYRSALGSKDARPVNRAPVTEEKFSDADFQFGSTYAYFIRTVSLGENGEPVESVDSTSVSILAKDVFAPAAPDSITIAASPRTVSIFFASNLEKDIAGYRIYRSTEPDRPLDQWTAVTEKLIQTNTFQDDNVEPRKTYFYYIVAVDKNGNVSGRSVVVSETVP